MELEKVWHQGDERMCGAHHSLGSKPTSWTILVLPGSASSRSTCSCVTLWKVLDSAICKVSKMLTPAISNCSDQRVFCLVYTKLYNYISVAITSFVHKNPCKIKRAKEKWLRNPFKCQQFLHGMRTLSIFLWYWVTPAHYACSLRVWWMSVF